MKIAIAADHGGFELKKQIIEHFKLLNLLDFGTTDTDSVDYPDYAKKVVKAILSGAADLGILVCGTGIGMCITANKFRGVRAALCSNLVVAELSRRHNNANVLCLSGEFLGLTAIESIVRAWLTTPFDGGRHQRRLDLIAEIERETGL